MSGSVVPSGSQAVPGTAAHGGSVVPTYLVWEPGTAGPFRVTQLVPSETSETHRRIRSRNAHGRAHGQHDLHLGTLCANWRRQHVSRPAALRDMITMGLATRCPGSVSAEKAGEKRPRIDRERLITRLAQHRAAAKSAIAGWVGGAR